MAGLIEKDGGTLTDARATELGELGELAPNDDEHGDELPVGDIDRYRVTDEHARGGLGRILRAEDESLGRTVAVKELLSRSPALEQRFIREALITARLQHPGIVPVHEAGRWPSGDPYYVMKLIQGETLKQRIAEATSINTRLSLLPHAIAVADAIAYAHSQGVIHRDIKPSNVVVGAFGETVVVDWGLAEEVGESGFSSQAGDIVGTPAYMPPEQARGEATSRRADVYSLGALLYQMLTGESPYASHSSGDRLACVLAGPPPSIRDLAVDAPADLAAIVEKAMTRDPMDRYPDAGALAADLKRFQTGKVVTAVHYSSIALVRRWLSRNRAAVAFAAAALVVIAAIGVLAIERVVDERNTARLERAQASEAHAASEARGAELLYLQAESSLLSDPTAAVAWLKAYPNDGPLAGQLSAIADQARALGVATSVLDVGQWVLAIDFLAGSRLVTADKSGAVRLWDLATSTSKVLEVRSSADSRLAVAPDRTRFAYGAAAGKIIVVRADGSGSRQLEGHEDYVGLVRFSDDGTMLISSGADRVVRVWDLKSGKAVIELRGAGRGAHGNVSRDGGTIATITGERVRFRRVSEKRWHERRVQAVGGIRNFAVAPNQTTVAAVTDLGKVVAVDLATGSVRTLFAGGPAAAASRIEHFEYSPTGRFLAAAGADRTIRVWDLEAAAGPSEGRSPAAASDGEPMRVLRGHEDAIYMADFSPDESQIVSAGDDATARLWDRRTGAVTVLRGHTDDVIRAVFSSDGQQVATASLDGTVRVWPTRFDDSKVLVHEGFVGAVSFPRTGVIVSQVMGGEISLWKNDEPRRPVGSAWPGSAYPDWREKQPSLISVAGRWAAARRADGGVDLWEVESGRHRVLSIDSGSIVSIAFSPDEDEIACADGEGRVIVWPLTGGEPRVVLGDTITALTYAPDGSLVMATASELIVRGPTGAEIRHRLRGSGPAAASLGAFELVVSPYGDRIAAYRRTGLITVCERTAGSCTDLSTNGETILGLALSADATKVAAACADRVVRIWDLTSGELKVLTGHTDLVHDVEFAEGSGLLASSSYDKTVRLWNLVTGEHRVLRGHGESVEAVAFSPTGETLASASRDGTVRVWPIGRARPIKLDLSVLTTAVIRGERPVSRPRSASR